MRREGNIIEEIVEYSNMSDSFDRVLRGTKRKESHQGRSLLCHSLFQTLGCKRTTLQGALLSP